MTQARMQNPAVVLPDAMRALRVLDSAVARHGSVPATTLGLVHLRVSQINGCGVCIESYVRFARAVGESMERLVAVAAWRESPYFTAPERTALALTEVVTRLSDRSGPVPDAVWQQAVRYYDELGLATLILSIAAVNIHNRIAVTTRQVVGDRS